MQHLLLGVMLFVQTPDQCQTSCCSSGPTGLRPRPLVEARGHYKSLSAFTTGPQTGGRALDQITFELTPADLERAKRRRPHYLSEREDIVIPDFPANSSEQTRKELDYLLQLQERRTQEDIDRSLYFATVWYNHATKRGDAQYERMRRNLFHIGRSIGTWFNADSLPATASLIANAWLDASYYIWKFKNHYVRARPYVLESKLKNLENANWPAYPSGHAGNSYVNAYIFQELAPEFADVFVKDALDMAHSREIIGVHYPSDSEISRQLARQLVNKLFENPRFQEDFARAQEEWQQVRARNF